MTKTKDKPRSAATRPARETVVEDEEELEVSEPEIVELDPDDEGDDAFTLPTGEEAGGSKGALPPSEFVYSDPLRQYLAEVSRHPLLSVQEEVDLATRFQDDGDLDAAYRMVVANLRLVVKIAYEFRRNLDNLMDLIQEGNIGLMKAVDKYDPTRGVRLSSYAAWWIRAYMIRYILNNWSLVKIGTTQNQRRLFFNLKKEKEALEAQGFKPEPKLLASRLNVKESEVVEMEMRMSGPDMSLNVPLDEETDTTRMDLIPADDAPTENVVEDNEFKEFIGKKLKEFRATLEGRDLQIFDERLVAEEPRTLRELGEEFGVSRERVRQLEEELKGKLKLFLEDANGVIDVLG